VSRKTRAIRYVIDPAIKIGINSGYEFAENYDLNAEPKHVVWTVKPGSESLPEIRLEFIYLYYRSQCVYDK
jgi:hypothetical protein